MGSLEAVAFFFYFPGPLYFLSLALLRGWAAWRCQAKLGSQDVEAGWEGGPDRASLRPEGKKVTWPLLISRLTRAGGSGRRSVFLASLACEPEPLLGGGWSGVGGAVSDASSPVCLPQPLAESGLPCHSAGACPGVSSGCRVQALCREYCICSPHCLLLWRHLGLLGQ